MAESNNTGMILYYVNGVPVYLEDVMNNKEAKSTMTPAEQASAQVAKNTKDARTPQGRDKTPDKKDKDGRPTAKRVLIRGKDGKLNVQYVNTETGKVIPSKNLDNYRVIGANTQYDSFFYRQRRERDDEEDTKDKKKKEEAVRYEHGTNEGTGSKASAAPSPNSSGPAEQGDTSDYGWADAPAVTKERHSLVDAGIDPTNPTNIPENAKALSLDSYDYSTGNNPHPLEGTDLNTVTSNSVNREDYDAATRERMAKTLAGEMDTRYTDLDSEEGFAEAAGIMSTMENRDLANGPNNSITDAIDKPGAYSTWNNDEMAANAEANYQANKAKYDGMVDRYLSDEKYRQPYTNYVNPAIAKPGWVDNLTDKTQIGPHLFGVDESIANKIPEGKPLTDAQKEQVTKDIVNQNALQSFAAPAGVDIASTPPDIDVAPSATSGWGEMAKAGPIGAVGEDVGTNVGTNTSWGNMAEAGPVGAMNTVANDPNVTAGASSATSDGGYAGPSSFASPSFASTVEKGARVVTDGDPNTFDNERMAPQPDTSQNFDTGRFGPTNNPDVDTSNFDASRFGPTDVSTTAFDSNRFGGFGSFVTNDPAATSSTPTPSATPDYGFSSSPYDGSITPGATSAIDSGVDGGLGDVGGSTGSDADASASGAASGTGTSSTGGDSSGGPTGSSYGGTSDSGTASGVSDGATGSSYSGGIGSGDSSSSTTSSSSPSTSSTGGGWTSADATSSTGTGVFGGAGGIFGGDGSDSDSGFGGTDGY